MLKVRSYVSLILMALCLLALPALASAQAYLGGYGSPYQYQSQYQSSYYGYQPSSNMYGTGYGIASYYTPRCGPLSPYGSGSSIGPYAGQYCGLVGNYGYVPGGSGFYNFGGNYGQYPGAGVNAFGYNGGIPTGDTDALGNQLCYWQGYGRSPCSFNPHQWVYDPYTGTWY